MSLAPARLHTVYTGIPWQRHATAACYCCGAQMPAQYVVWLHHADSDQYMVLCGVCYRDAQDDAEGLLESEDRDQWQVLHAGEQHLPHYLRS